MISKEIYKIWAPSGAEWVEWVRPVPFIMIKDNLKILEVSNFTIPNINYIKKEEENTIIIVDLPGNKSIEEAIALSKLNYRPIPVYNGTNEQEGAMATTDNHSIAVGLVWGASELKKIEISNDAPAAFLLDTNRTNSLKMNPSVFDNSWDIYGQDLPSAKYLIKNNINKIIVRTEKLQKDLKKILYKYQKEGIKIFLTDGYEEPKNVKIRKPLFDDFDD